MVAGRFGRDVEVLRRISGTVGGKIMSTSINTIRIGSKRVGRGQPVFIIAEAGVNHNGDLQMAKKLIDAAAEAGADAVKFQTFRAQELVSASTPKARYQKETTGTDESQFDMIKKLELSPSDHDALIQ